MNRRLGPSELPRNNALRREFDRAYRTPGARYLGAACALGTFAVLSYYLLDVLHAGLPWSGGVQSLRLLLAATCAVVSVLCWANVDTATRYYGPLFVTTIIATMASACLISYIRHMDEPPAALVSGLERSLAICVVVIVGFSRLTALSTIVLVCAIPAIAIALVWMTSPISVFPELARTSIQLLVIAASCYFLRRSIQAREWDLFLLARENLRRNKYSKELEQAKLAVEEADNAKARFLANMSHEVGTPMNGVLQILDVVGEHASEEDRMLIDKGRKAGKALLRVLNGILDYSKLAHGSAVVNVGNTDIVEVCRTIAELHTASAVASGIDLRTRLDLPPTGETTVMIDEVKLFEIINNLVSNALKFTSSGFVELVVGLDVPAEAALPSAKLDIIVSDSGCGIDADDLGKVFLPFYKRPRDELAGSRGTGLGLSIVQELVQILEGEIHVQSVPGRGSTFTIALPVTLVEPRRDAESAASSAKFQAMDDVSSEDQPEFRGLSLLLVDDNELNTMLAARLMAAIGFEVVTAADGALALDQVKARQFDLILMDCQMPVMDGYEATRAIRQLERQSAHPRRTPVVAVTAYSLAGEREKCLAAGMDDFLAKPYSLGDLRPKLRRWLRRALSK